MIEFNTHALSLVLSQVWQVTALVVAVGLLTRLVCRHRPHLAYLLWMLVILKCITPPLWSSPTGVFSWAQVQVETTPSSSQPEKLNPWSLGGVSLAGNESLDNASIVALPADKLPGQRTDQAAFAALVLASIWLIGVTALLVLAVVNWCVCRRRLSRSTVPIDGLVESLVDELTGRLGLKRKVRLVVTQCPIGPVLFGILRPTIFVPDVLLRGKTREQIEPILAHELIHLRRGDCFMGGLQFVAQVMWWFHPLVWWANRQICRERERCCDEELLAGLDCPPAVYARCLLDVLEQKQALRPVLAFPGVRAAEVTSRRLENIMKHTNRFYQRSPRFLWLVFVAASLVILPGAGLTIEAETQGGRDTDILTPALQADVSEDGAGNSNADQADSEDPSAGSKIVADDREAEESLKKNIRGFKIVRDEDGYVTSARTQGRTVTKEDLINISKLNWSKKRSTRIETDSWEAIPQPELRLSKAQLSDDDLVYLKDFTFLRKLDLLRNDDITDAGLMHLSNLTNLEVLFIIGTGTTDAGLAHLKGMTKLSSIWMGGPHFTDAGLAHLKGKEHLTNLSIPGTSVTDAGFEQFKDKRFREIDLSGTRITDKSLSHIGRMTDLLTLNLANTDVTQSGLDNLVDLTKLKAVDLSGIEIADQWLENLKNLENLWGLTLNNTKITGSGLKFLEHLPISFLSISDNEIEDAALQSLGGFRNLEFLFVDNTKITGPELEHLKDLTELMVISVSNAELTDEGLKHLHVFKEYRNPKSVALNVEGKDLAFNLGGNGLSYDAIEDLKAVLPHCTIASW